MAVLKITVPSIGETLELSNVSFLYESVPFFFDKGQQKGYTCTGQKRVFSNRVYETSCILNVTNLTKTQIIPLRDFLEKKIRLKLRRFSVQVSSLDLGKGVGIAVDNCIFLSESTTGIFPSKLAGLFDLRLPFNYKVV